MYEDDGATIGYLVNQHAWTTCAYTHDFASGRIAVSISTNGTFAALPATRAVTIQLLNVLPAVSVSVATSRGTASVARRDGRAYAATQIFTVTFICESFSQKKTIWFGSTPSLSSSLYLFGQVTEWKLCRVEPDVALRRRGRYARREPRRGIHGEGKHNDTLHSAPLVARDR